MHANYKLVGIALALIVAISAVVLFVPREEKPVSADRFAEPDRLFDIVESNVRRREAFEVIVDIDHARLGAEAGSPMPPSRVLIWSDPALDAAILQHNPLAAMDLPLRVLVYEDPSTGEAAVISNSYDFLLHRHSLPDDAALRAQYQEAIDAAMEGIPTNAIKSFATDTMATTGLVTLTSPYDVEATEQRLMDTINAQSDTVVFGVVDLGERARAQGVDVGPLRLILFGGPGPGAKAMAKAPTLGLDAFCQKLLIWQDQAGAVQVTFNDLVALAERQQVPASIPLRVINKRLTETFGAALDE